MCKNNVLTKFEKEFGLTVNEEGQIVTNSLKVAEYYGKEHKDVLKKIRGFIELIPELTNEGNFSLVEYLDAKGESRPMYNMNRQGFSLLVNKFTGDEATIFTYKYTKAFEEMALELEHLREQKAEIENKLHTDNQLSLEEYNKIRFSEKRTIKTFEFCDIDDVKQLVEDFINYALLLDTQTRVIRCSSAVKGLQKLHDKLAMDNIDNIGNCYNILKFKDKIKKIAHMAENRRRGQIVGHRNKTIKQLQDQIRVS